MDVFVDDRKVDFACEPSETLEQTVHRLQSQTCPSGHVVVGVRCDGIHLTDDELSDAMAKPAGEYGCIEIATSTPSALVTEALETAADMLTETDPNREQCAELLSRGKTNEGITALGDCLSVWQQVHAAVTKSIYMLGIDPDRVQVGGEPLNAALALPMERLGMVRDALKVQDYVLLADVLQYEFQDVTEKWHSLIETVQQLAAVKGQDDQTT